MNIFLPIITLFSIATLAAAPGKEPPLHYTLTVGEKTFSINKNVPFVIDGINGKHKAKLTAADYRIFPYQDVKFKYPSNFNFEANILKPNYKSWTLSGSSCRIMLAVIQGKHSLEELTKMLTGRFGELNTKLQPMVIELGKKTYKGIKVDVSISGQRVSMDILSLPMSDGWSKYLQIQYLHDNIRPDSQEHVIVKRMLEKSFEETKAYTNTETK